jgi:hypothetical protein
MASSIAASLPGQDDSEYTGIAVVNLKSTPADLTFTAYGLDGALLTGDRIANPTVRKVPASAQISIMDFELWGEGLPAAHPLGWFKIESTGGIAGLLVWGAMCFRFRRGDHS